MPTQAPGFDKVLQLQGIRTNPIEPEQLLRQAARLASQALTEPFADFWRRLLSQHQLQDPGIGAYSTHYADTQALRVLAAREADWLTRFRLALEGNALDWREAKGNGRGNTLTLMSELELQLQLEGQHAVERLHEHLEAALAANARQAQALAGWLGAATSTGSPWSADAVTRAFVGSLPLDELNATLVSPVMRRYEQLALPALQDALRRLSALLAPVGEEAALAEPVALRDLRNSATESRPAPRTTSDGLWAPDEGLVDVVVSSHASAPAVRTMPEPARTHDAGPARSQPRYRDLVSDKLAAWREQSQRDGSWDAPSLHAPEAHVFGTSEVLTIANVMQGEDAAPFVRALRGEAGTSLQSVIRSEMLKAASQLGFDGQQTRFAQDEEDAIDLVAMLFSTLADNNDLLPRGSAIFGRLVLPYVKAAVLDDSLFNRRTHPARRLLDALAETCDGNAGETPVAREMLDRADRVVEQVVTRFQEDQAIFELAAQELRDFLDQQRHKAELAERRMAEALHGRERLLFARRAAHDAVCACTSTRMLEGGVFAFVSGEWQNALVQTWLRHGANSNRYSQLREAGDALQAMDADAEALRGDELARRFAESLPALRDALELNGLQGPAADEALARLLHGMVHGTSPRRAQPAPVAPVDDSEGRSVLTLVQAGAEPADPALVARLRKLRAGQGLRIRDEGGHQSAARIAWISPLTSRFLIVDRRGQRKLVTSAEELAVLVMRGDVTVRAVDAPVDHAMRQVWERLGAARVA